MKTPSAGDNNFAVVNYTQYLLKKWKTTKVLGFMTKLWMKHPIKVQEDSLHRVSTSSSTFNVSDPLLFVLQWIAETIK